MLTIPVASAQISFHNLN